MKLSELKDKVTPGPWIKVYSNERCPIPGGPPIAIQRSDERWKCAGTICEINAQGNGQYDPVVTEANAALLAKAQLLFECAAVITELRDGLAAAMRVMDDKAVTQFLTECSLAGVRDGIGVRARALLAKLEEE